MAKFHKIVNVEIKVLSGNTVLILSMWAINSVLITKSLRNQIVDFPNSVKQTQPKNNYWPSFFSIQPCALPASRDSSRYKNAGGMAWFLVEAEVASQRRSARYLCKCQEGRGGRQAGDWGKCALSIRKSFPGTRDLEEESTSKPEEHIFFIEASWHIPFNQIAMWSYYNVRTVDSFRTFGTSH